MIKYIFLLFILCCSGCRHAQTEDTVIKVSVLRGPSVIAFADWLENPPIIDNKKVQVKVVDSPDLAQALLIKQETDIAVLPMINAANLYNKGIKIKLAGCPIWGTLYLVEKTPLKEPALYVFGNGTTPDILTRYYLGRRRSDYPLNYAFNTAGEITQGILAGKVNRAVLGEPFLSIALRKDSSLRITADLNHLTDSDTLGFAQTAVVYTPTMEKYRIAFEDALRASCQKAVRYPKETIHSLEEHGIFAQGALTPESIERCKIHYLSAIERKTPSWISCVSSNSMNLRPSAGGFPMPDLSPKNNEIAKNNHYNSRYRYPLGGMATIRRYSQPTGADTFTSPTRTDTLRMARLR